MKCSVSTKQILEAIVILSKIVKKKNQLPVLSCIKLESSETLLTLSATNLETACVYTVPIHNGEEGVIAVPADLLLRTLQAQRESVVDLFATKTSLTISAKKSKSTINALPHDDFPSIPQSETENSFTIPVDILKRGFESVLFSVSTSTIRPELASVYIYPLADSTGITFVGTDSFRLSERKIRIPDVAEFPETLLPSHNARDLLSVLPTDGDVQVSFEEGQINISTSSFYFIARIIDGSFPPYQNIIPSSASTEATILKEDFNTILKKNAIFSNDAQQVHLALSVVEGVCSVSSKNDAVGESEDSIELSATGEDIAINFNLKYLLECLSYIHTDSLQLQFSGAQKPLIIRGVGDPNYMYLVMPLNR